MRGLYIHIPFCSSKCPYCDFFSYVEHDTDLIKTYCNTLLKDLKRYDNLSFDTIYIGGGTPSSIEPKILESLIGNILSIIDYKGVEFTIEANPESITDDFLTVIDKCKVNRLSVGVQSLNDKVLALLGRKHTSSDIYKSISLIPRDRLELNIDLIYDIPLVSNDLILDSAKSIVSLNPDHISAYSYQHEKTGYLSEYVDADNTLFNDIEIFLKSSYYNRYEISNFAKSGKVSHHNIIYWSMGEYIGIGSSASSMFHRSDGKRIRYTKTSDIKSYISDIDIYDEYEELDIMTQISEEIIFGLRMTKGVSIDIIESKFNINISDYHKKTIDTFVSQGLLQWEKKRLITTKRGCEVLDTLSSSLLYS